MKSSKKTFTLVELIIVIAIIAILAVTAFLVLTKWIGKSRDSRRISDINSINYALQIYITEKSTLPLPENYTGVYDTGFALARYQGIFTNNTSSQMSNISKDIKDPQGNNYGYSVTYDRKQYQVRAYTENQMSYGLNKVYADSQYAKIQGNYGGFLVTFTGGIHALWNIPSLFLFSGTLITSGQQYVLGNNNILQDNKSLDNIYSLQYTDVSALYNGDNSDDSNVLTNIVNIYSGSNGITTTNLAQIAIQNAAGGVTVAIASNTQTNIVQKTIVAGVYHTCGIATDGTAYCWGWNNNGQLGDGTTTDSSVPVKVVGQKFTSLTVGRYHTCGIATNGKTYCWGTNGNGQLGNGSSTNTSTPTQVSTYNFTSLTAGWMHTCGIATDGKSYCWGYNNRGQLGNGSTTKVKIPTQISTYDFTSLIASYGHTCGITTDGTAYCWGYNQYGQLGNSINNNTLTANPTPTTISTYRFTSLTAGEQYSCGITTDGTAYCWGYNYRGELGNSTNGGIDTANPTPTTVSTYKFTSLTAGGDHTCGIATDGKSYCWGYNPYGQLGNGNTTNTNSPIQVSTYSFTSLTAGNGHTCGIATDGKTYCWGRNPNGQLGNGSTTIAKSPAVVTGF